MTLYFMRHGQTNYNVPGLCNDDPRDDVHLTELGRQQAAHAADQLRQIPLRRVYVSELPRTQQTATIVNQFHNVPMVIDVALNDIRTGYNGRPVREYQAVIAHDPWHARVNGGETLREHQQRVLGFIERLKSTPERPLLVVAHEETLRVIAAHFRGIDDTALLTLSFRNCELLEFDA
jgi:broad specificity phosphatase PhoE